MPGLGMRLLLTETWAFDLCLGTPPDGEVDVRGKEQDFLYVLLQVISLPCIHSIKYY